MSSWRPITIFSVIRRVIERVLDKELRQQIELNHNQRGFTSNLAGCHINSRLIDGCLKDAKTKKKDCTVVFLDISRAFDHIGHSHIAKSLAAQGVSSDLQELISSLLRDNTFQVEIGNQRTKRIPIRCGVPQGGPLSPTLFNLAVDFVYKDLCDPTFSRQHGYVLDNNMETLCLSGFADDLAVTACNTESAIRIIDVIKSLLLSIGLEVNASKCCSVILKHGELKQANIKLSTGKIITSISKDEIIKYLGCNFNNELMLNKDSIKTFNENLEKLAHSPLLKPNQKLNIINQYIFPTLAYPFQTAPLIKIPLYILDGLDIIIRRTVKEVIGLPDRTATAMLYAPRKLRGLGLLNCKWEAPLQHISMVRKLSTCDDPRFMKIFDLDQEINASLARLKFSQETFNTYASSRKLRMHLSQLYFKYF